MARDELAPSARRVESTAKRKPSRKIAERTPRSRQQTTYKLKLTAERATQTPNISTDERINPVAHARARGRDSARVTLASRREKALKDVASKIESESVAKALVVPTNVRGEDSVAGTAEDTVEEFGGLDVGEKRRFGEKRYFEPSRNGRDQNREASYCLRLGVTATAPHCRPTAPHRHAAAPPPQQHSAAAPPPPRRIAPPPPPHTPPTTLNPTARRQTCRTATAVRRADRSSSRPRP